jgi:hypothetical protein
MPTGSTAVTCQAQGYTWRRPLDRTTTESAHGHMLAHHHPYTQRRQPLLPLKESTHNKALLSPEDQVFACCRLKHHEASTRQAAWPNLGTSGARKPHFWGHFLSSTAWVAQTQHACTMKTNTSTAEECTPASPNTRVHSLWCFSSPQVRGSLTKRALSSRRDREKKTRKSNPRRPRLPGVQKKRAQW